MQMKTEEVFLVEPNESDRDEFRSALESAGLFVKAFASAEAMLIHLMRYPTNAHNGRCVVLNEYQTGISGLEALGQVRKLEPELRVLLISRKTSVDAVLQAWRSGASNFLVQPFMAKEFVAAVKACLDQKVDYDQPEEGFQIEDLRATYKGLTSREREVLLLVSKGRRNQEIGSDLGISVATVKMHRANLMRKLEIDSVAQLVSFHHQCVRFL